MWNSLLEEIWVWLEISIKNSNELVILDVITAHCRLEITRFVASSELPVTVDYIHTSLAPLRDFSLD